MKKTTTTYGVIAGVVVSLMLVLSLPLHKNGILNYSSGMVVGYASMVIALSVIFFAIRGYRDNYGGGVVTFWQGAKIGGIITIIASLLYAVTWEVCYHTIAKDFTADMTRYYIEEKVAAGAPPQEVEAVKRDMEEFARNYENPVIRFGMTLFEILPVGLLITLISAGLLRRKNFLPTMPPSGES